MKHELKEHPVLQHAHLLIGVRENVSEEQALKRVERVSLESMILLAYPLRRDCQLICECRSSISARRFQANWRWPTEDSRWEPPNHGAKKLCPQRSLDGDWVWTGKSCCPRVVKGMNPTVRLGIGKDCGVRSYRSNEFADLGHLETYLHAVSFTNLAESREFKVGLDRDCPIPVRPKAFGEYWAVHNGPCSEALMKGSPKANEPPVSQRLGHVPAGSGTALSACRGLVVRRSHRDLRWYRRCSVSRHATRIRERYPPGTIIR